MQCEGFQSVLVGEEVYEVEDEEEEEFETVDFVGGEEEDDDGKSKEHCKSTSQREVQYVYQKITLLIIVYQQAFSYSQKLLGGEINEQIRIGNCLFFQYILQYIYYTWLCKNNFQCTSNENWCCFVILFLNSSYLGFFSDGVEVIEDGDDDEEAADEEEEEPTKAKTTVNGSSKAPVVVNGSTQKEGGGGE